MSKQTSLRGLRTFCMAARFESFRDAADRMYVTASAVSHQIKNLEDEIGQALFERSARHIRLTDTGRALYRDISPMIDDIDSTIAGYRGQPQRRQLRISVQPFFASELFVPKLDEFSKANPDIDLQVETSDESAEKVVPNADLSIRIFRSAPKGLESHRLFPLRLIPTGSPKFQSRLEITDNIIHSDFPLIVHEGRSKAWKDWSRHAGVELPAAPKSIRFASMIAVARAAQKGLGAALIPVDLCESWFRDDDLVPLFDTTLTTDDAYYCVANPESAGEDHVVRLRDWVVESFTRAA